MARHETIRVILAQFAYRPIDRFFPEPFRPVPPMASVEAHRRIASAIADADPIRAEFEMREHLIDLVQLLRTYEQGWTPIATPD
jgi:DNA-binding FadR family transcriptional regulator